MSSILEQIEQNRTQSNSIRFDFVRNPCLDVISIHAVSSWVSWTSLRILDDLLFSGSLKTSSDSTGHVARMGHYVDVTIVLSNWI